MRLHNDRTTRADGCGAMSGSSSLLQAAESHVQGTGDDIPQSMITLPSPKHGERPQSGGREYLQAWAGEHLDTGRRPCPGLDAVFIFLNTVIPLLPFPPGALRRGGGAAAPSHPLQEHGPGPARPAEACKTIA